MKRTHAGDLESDDPRDDDLDPLLTAHLAHRLDPQLGRALAAFEREPDVTARGSRTPRRRLFIGALAGGLVAAAVAVAWSLLPTESSPRAPTQIAQAPDPAPAVVSPALLMSDETLVERVISWEAVDEGPDVMDDAIPVRQVRYVAVQEFEWKDPQRNITVRLAVPLEQEVLVRQTAF